MNGTKAIYVCLGPHPLADSLVVVDPSVGTRQELVLHTAMRTIKEVSSSGAALLVSYRIYVNQKYFDELTIYRNVHSSWLDSDIRLPGVSPTSPVLFRDGSAIAYLMRSGSARTEVVIYDIETRKSEVIAALEDDAGFRGFVRMASVARHADVLLLVRYAIKYGRASTEFYALDVVKRRLIYLPALSSSSAAALSGDGDRAVVLSASGVRIEYISGDHPPRQICTRQNLKNLGFRASRILWREKSNEMFIPLVAQDKGVESLWKIPLSAGAPSLLLTEDPGFGINYVDCY